VLYAILADILVAFHGGYVAFVVLGEFAILIGAALGCGWARNRWFRSLHLLAIAVVALEAVFHFPCPLTAWEYQLRALAGQATSTESFVGRLVHFLFMDGDNRFEEWVYEYLHIGFGILVLATLLLIPPRWRTKPQVTIEPSAV
jgi:hypothetical protein